MARTYNAVVGEITPVTSETIILRVAPDGWELGEYLPGQFVVLGLPYSAPRTELSDPEPEEQDAAKFIVRAYSIASSSKQSEYLEFYISLVRSGALTPRLFALQRGDRLHLGTRFSGMFTIDDIPPQTHLVLMATGTGIAPYMSMIRSAVSSASERRVAVIQGASHSWDLGYRSELATLGRMLDHFTYIPAITRPKDEIIPWGGESGYLQELWQKKVIEQAWGQAPTPDDTHIFLCGNPGMIQETLPILQKEGFREHSRKNPGEIHMEKYW